MQYKKLYIKVMVIEHQVFYKKVFYFSIQSSNLAHQKIYYKWQINKTKWKKRKTQTKY
jgi:hypothetical protein